MAFKVMLFLLASFLLATTRVSCNSDKFNIEATFASKPVPPPLAIAPTVKPIPIPAPPVKAPVSAPSPPLVPVAKAPPPLPVTKPPVIAPRPPIKSRADCFPQCKERCYVHSRKNLCMRACVTCCDRCRCVPPGTYGNREMCGKCYTGMLTHGDKPKCP